MGKSVKLTDGSYIDAEGVYDVTKEATQAALNSRIGTLLSAYFNTANTWTPSALNETYTAASLALTDGIWLVFGHCYDRTGYLRIRLTGGTYTSGVHHTENAGETLDCFGVIQGGQTVNLILSADKAGVTHTWTQDLKYWSLIAICIG